MLGIAPIDRLGELTWLGPISVILFGLLVGLVVHAASVTRFDRWMLLLTVGTFAGAYPLMYFAQEYIPLGPAVLISAGVAVAIIGVRAVDADGTWLALGGRRPARGGDHGRHARRGHLDAASGHPAHGRGAGLLHRRDDAHAQGQRRIDQFLGIPSEPDRGRRRHTIRRSKCRGGTAGRVGVRRDEPGKGPKQQRRPLTIAKGPSTVRPAETRLPTEKRIGPRPVGERLPPAPCQPARAMI